MDSLDVLVMGRNTYELVVSSGHWPYGSKQVKVLSSTLSKASNSSPSTVEIKATSPEKLYRELKILELSIYILMAVKQFKVFCGQV